MSSSGLFPSLPLWPLTPLALACLIVSGETLGADGRPSELPSQVITANPLGNESPATPSSVLEGDELVQRREVGRDLLPRPARHQLLHRLLEPEHAPPLLQRQLRPLPPREAPDVLLPAIAKRRQRLRVAMRAPVHQAGDRQLPLPGETGTQFAEERGIAADTPRGGVEIDLQANDIIARILPSLQVGKDVRIGSLAPVQPVGPHHQPHGFARQTRHAHAQAVEMRGAGSANLSVQ